MSVSALHRPRYGVLAAGLAAAAMACDGAQPAMDASTPPAARTAAVSLRIDVLPDRPASLTVLAFRAAFSGMAPADVLGLVDPLAAQAPERDCVLRDVDRAAADLVARGDAIDLEELTGITVGLPDPDAGEALIRPSPRLYPEVATAISGVVAEAGPVGLAALPERLRVFAGDAAADSAAGAVVPPPARVASLRSGARVESTADLDLALAGGGPPATLELRPLGATVALVCAVTGPSFVVSRQLLAALMAASGAAPGAPLAAAIDLVRRTEQRLPLGGAAIGGAAAPGATEARLSVEVRTSTLVELRP